MTILVPFTSGCSLRGSSLFPFHDRDGVLDDAEEVHDGGGYGYLAISLFEVSRCVPWPRRSSNSGSAAPVTGGLSYTTATARRR